MKLKTPILLLLAGLLSLPMMSSAQSAMDVRHERERSTLRAQQQRELAALSRQLQQALPGEIGKVRRGFNTEFRQRLNDAKVELKVTYKAELRAALNDRMRDRAIQNYIASVAAARDQIRAELKSELQAEVVALRKNIGIQLRALAKEQAQAFKELLIKQRDERAAGGTN